MATFKNPYAGTYLATVAKHLMTVRGWTHQQVQAWFEGLWDRLGPEKRFRLITRYQNRIVRAWVLESPTKVWTDHQGNTVCHRATGNAVSSTIVMKRAA